jgi:hypothetical protein
MVFAKLFLPSKFFAKKDFPFPRYQKKKIGGKNDLAK